MSNPTTVQARLQAAVEEAERVVRLENEGNAAMLARFKAERTATMRAIRAFALSLLHDIYTPVELFSPWASVRRFREWRDDPIHNLDVRVIHGRCCVRPSDFFALWAKLPAAKRNRRDTGDNQLPAGPSAGATPSSLGGRVGGNARRRVKRRAAGSPSSKQ